MKLRVKHKKLLAKHTSLYQKCLANAKYARDLDLMILVKAVEAQNKFNRTMEKLKGNDIS